MTVTITGQLSDFAKLAAANYLTGNTPTAVPTELMAALYSTSAGPDGLTPPTESVLTGYTQQGPVTLAPTAGNLPVANTAGIDWTGLGEGHLGGIALLDPSDGEIYFWADMSEDLADGAAVHIAVGGFTLS